MPDKLNLGQTSSLLVRPSRDSKENQQSLWTGFQFRLETPLFSRGGWLGREVCKIKPISVLTSVK